MVKKYSSYNPSVPSSVTGAGYVADLMTDVGNRMTMKYNTSGSSAGITDANNGLSYYGLTGTITTFSDSLASSEIMLNNKPFYMQGYHLVETLRYNDTVGHAWVVDGMKQHRDKTTNTYMWYLGYSPGVIPEGEPATQAEALEAALEAGYDRPEDLMITYEVFYSAPQRIYHMNWGENGQSDGYYTGLPYVIFNGTTYSFTINREMLYDIRSNAK